MQKHDSMRGFFAFELHKQMTDPDIYLLMGGLGFGMFDALRESYPERTINVGASEQLMLDMAVGLAYEGKIPVCYSITPFLLYRAFETIRTYIDHEKLPVKLIGGGRNKDYAHDGYSHNAEDDRDFIYQLNKISAYWPESKDQVNEMYIKRILFNDRPTYVNLVR